MIKIKRSNLQNILVLIHILFAITGFYTYLSNYKFSEDLIMKKTLNKQEIIAKAGSVAIENLFNNIENQLSSFVFSFAKIDDAAIIDTNTTKATFTSYIERALQPINEIALYNEYGKLLIIENRQQRHIGENERFSELDFIQWSKNPLNRNKIFISNPYIAKAGSSVGKTIMVFAEPIYFGNTYKGTITIRLLVNEFKSTFIDSLNLGTDEDAFIIDTSGLLIPGNNTLLSTNLFFYAQKQKQDHYNDFIQKFRTVLTQNQTQTTWKFNYPNAQEKTFLVGVSKIDVPNTERDLYMFVDTSTEEVTDSLKGLHTYGFIWLGFGVLTTTVGGIIIMFLKNK